MLKMLLKTLQKMKAEFNIYNFNVHNASQPSDQIQIHELEQEKAVYNSSEFQQKKDLLKNLFQTEKANEVPNKFSLIEKDSKIFIRSSFAGSDTVQIYGWKNVKNCSARLIGTYDNVVLLECLINKEEKVYEEREFEVSLFEGYDLEIGKLFYLRYFKRPNEAKIEVHDDPHLTFKDDFPKLNFNELFKKSKLFNPDH